MTKLEYRPLGLSPTAVSVGIHEAKTQLSRLLREVEHGQEVTIMRGSTPIAKLIGLGPRPARELGMDSGTIRISPDFDAEDERLVSEFEHSDAFPA